MNKENHTTVWFKSVKCLPSKCVACKGSSFKIEIALESPVGLVKTQIAGYQPQRFDLIVQEWGSWICISNKFVSNDDGFIDYIFAALLHETWSVRLCYIQPCITYSLSNISWFDMTLIIFQDCIDWAHNAQQYSSNSKGFEVTYTWGGSSFLSL